MNFTLARQPLVPAVLTLLALAVICVCVPEPHAAAAGPGEVGAVIPAPAPGMAVSTPAQLLMQLQSAFPVWSKLLAALLILFTGMSVGRMSVYYNLYSVGTCLAIPLFGIIACGIGTGGEYLAGYTSAALLALSTRNFCRAFRNGYGFDAIFRATLYLGLLLLLAPATLPLLLLLPLAVLLFRRTLREMAVAVAGLLLAPFLLCYVNWGAGGDFTAPPVQTLAAFLSGAPFGFLASLSLPQFVVLGGILLLDIFGVFFFFSDFYAVGTKPRFILVFNIGVLALSAGMLCSPATTAATAALTAVPSALLLPFFFVRIHRAVSGPLYLLLLAASLLRIFLQ